MKTTVVTSATGEPVTLKEAKVHLRVSTSFTGDDAYITDLIKVSRGIVEDYTSRKLCRQTVRAYYDEWPSSAFKLPYGKAQSIGSTAIVYKMSTGNSTSFSSTAWIADTVSEPSRVVLNNGDSWPSDTLYNSNPIQIDFICGYTTGGANSSTKVPERLRQIMKMLVSNYYEYREPVLIGTHKTDIPLNNVENMLREFDVKQL